MTRRFLSLFLACLILAGSIPFLAFEAEATPNTHPNIYVNTGNQRADIIGVALTQVGYYEGPNNDTKYGVWYGYNNLGWCGIFVSWCAEQAGIPTSVIPKAGLASPSAFGLTQKPEGYIPQSGDLFFSKTHGHVGLVYYLDGDYFYSVEGNTWENGPEGVYIRRHAIRDFYYASPNYQGGGSHSYAPGSETAHPHREFYRCADCGDQYFTGKTLTRTDCQQCRQSICTHSYGTWTQAGTLSHVRTCSLCWKQESAAHSWTTVQISTPATCAAAGSATQKCTVCGVTGTVQLPRSDVHTYGDWTLADAKTHTRTCTVCRREDKQQHDLSPAYLADEAQHWYDCSVCQQQVDTQPHQFPAECGAPCTVCGYTSREGHRYTHGWVTDESAHWRVCDSCSIAESPQNHVFSGECDETCHTCGYVRQTVHSFSESPLHDEKHHWYACSVCDMEKDLALHTPSQLTRAGQAQFCTVCDRLLSPPQSHTHGYDSGISYDQEGHWGTCSCGQTMEKTAHTWSVDSQSCSVCRAPMSRHSSDVWKLLLWAGGLLTLIAAFILAVKALFSRKR